MKQSTIKILKILVSVFILWLILKVVYNIRSNKAHFMGDPTTTKATADAQAAEALLKRDQEANNKAIAGEGSGTASWCVGFARRKATNSPNNRNNRTPPAAGAKATNSPTTEPPTTQREKIPDVYLKISDLFDEIDIDILYDVIYDILETLQTLQNIPSIYIDEYQNAVEISLTFTNMNDSIIVEQNKNDLLNHILQAYYNRIHNNYEDNILTNFQTRYQPRYQPRFQLKHIDTRYVDTRHVKTKNVETRHVDTKNIEKIKEKEIIKELIKESDKVPTKNVVAVKEPPHVVVETPIMYPVNKSNYLPIEFILIICLIVLVILFFYQV
jgi:hypothetical protein